MGIPPPPPQCLLKYHFVRILSEWDEDGCRNARRERKETNDVTVEAPAYFDDFTDMN